MEAADLSVSDVVDNFRIMRLLGRGGMGEVYLARDTKLGRKVALKLLRSNNVLSKKEIENVLQEAQATASFNHPNIITIHALGEHKGLPYLALEYVEGQTLRERLGAERPGVVEACRIALSTAEALEEAHRHGISHRDLKPENILLGKDGRLRVLDFGLARLATPVDARAVASLPATNSTTDSGIAGTPPYMAPEQWRSEPSTTAVDMWAFGVILHELLWGRRPYDEQDVAGLVCAAYSNEPVPVATAGLPERLSKLLRRCLEKQIAQRATASEAVRQLREAVHGDRDRDPHAEPTTPSPFRGLQSFGEEHAEFFFGREREVAAFIELLRRTPVLPIVGLSGAGKSSFVRAGVVPRLHEQGAWTVISCRPGKQPFYSLAQKLFAFAPVSSRGGSLYFEQMQSEQQATVKAEDASLATIAKELAAEPRRLGAKLREIADSTRGRVLLFVDQLEESYTHAEHETRAFMQALCAAADDAQDPVRVCFTVRDDFLGRLAETSDAPEVREALSRITVLKSPGKAALRDILTRPLERLGYTFDDPAVVEDMINVVSGEHAGLPLLQFAARLLWDRKDETHHVLLRTAYDAMGGVAGALADHAESVLSGLTPQDVATVKQLFMRLVTPERTRRVVARAELTQGLGEAASALVDRLIEARLLSLRKGRSDKGESVEVEIAHESLIRRWHRLSQWVDEEREDLTKLSELRQAAELWNKRGQRSDEVWTSDALRDAQRFVAASSIEIPELVRSFVAASTSRERRRTRTRRLAFASIIAVLSVITFWAIVKERETAAQRELAERRRAEANRAAAASAFDKGDVLEARARLRTAFEIEDSKDARALWTKLQPTTLQWSLSFSPASISGLAPGPNDRFYACAVWDGLIHIVDRLTAIDEPLEGLTGPATAVAVSDDGELIVGGAVNGDLAVWRGRTLAQRIPHAHANRVTAILVSPDASRIVSADRDGVIKIFDVASAKPESELRGHEEAVTALLWKEKGRIFRSSGRDGTVRTWSLGAEQPIEVQSFGGAVSTMAVSADDSVVAVALRDRAVLLHADGARSEWPTGERVRSLTLSADGTRLAISGEKTTSVFDIRTRALERSFPAAGRVHLAKSLMVASDVTLQSFALGKPNGVDGGATLGGHKGPITAVAFSGDLVISAGEDGQLRTWDATTGRLRNVFDAHHGEISGLVVNRATGEIFSVGDDGMVRTRNAETGREGRAYPAGGIALSIDLSPDGRLAVICRSDGVVRRLELASGSYADHDIGDGCVARLAQNGRFIAAFVYNHPSVVLLDTATLKELATFKARDQIRALAIAGDSSMIATGTSGGHVELWDVESKRGRLLGINGNIVNALAFSKDGRTLVSAADVPSIQDRGDVVAWDVVSGARRLINNFIWAATAVAVNDDGRIATGVHNGYPRLFSFEGRPLWRGVALWAGGPLIQTHASGMTSGAELALLQAVAKSARRAVALGDLVCIQSEDDQLIIWSKHQSVPILSRRVEGLFDVAAGHDACLTLASGKAMVHHADATTETLVERGAHAIAATHESFIVALDEEVKAWRGGEVTTFKANAIVSAVASDGTSIFAGDEGGNVFALGNERSKLKGAISGLARRLVANGNGLLAVGYDTGEVGIFDTAKQERLSTFSVAGMADQLLFERNTLHALADSGDHESVDLTVFHRQYCDVLNELWSEVPIVWADRGVRALGRPTEHPCARSTGTPQAHEQGSGTFSTDGT